MNSINQGIQPDFGLSTCAANAACGADKRQSRTKGCRAKSLTAGSKFTFRALGLARLSAWFCAVIYLLGGTELLPMLLALGAGLEGSHTVHVARGQGQLTVVLSHGRGAAGWLGFSLQHQTGNVPHRHGAAARMFCLFATRSSGMADHVAGFATAQICDRAAQPGLVESGDSLSSHILAHLLRQPSGAAPAVAMAPGFPGPLYQQPARLALLRSVVLLV